MFDALQRRSGAEVWIGLGLGVIRTHRHELDVRLDRIASAAKVNHATLFATIGNRDKFM